MNKQIVIPDLKHGDLLLYGITSWYDYLISIKTWSPAVHCEVYFGQKLSIASRNWMGVNVYAFRSKGLIAILRPKEQFDWSRGIGWFNNVARGQAYDWKGLLCFTLAAKQGSPDKMFCSEFADRFYYHCNFQATHPNWDADKVAPGSFYLSPNFLWVYNTKVKQLEKD